MIILDTNVLSEEMKPVPAPEVHRWLLRQNAAELFTTAICEAEILAGAALLTRHASLPAQDKPIAIGVVDICSDKLPRGILYTNLVGERWKARCLTVEPVTALLKRHNLMVDAAS